MSSRKFITLLTIVGVRYASAHGDLHQQIASISAQIEKEPGNAELYLQRGEMHRLHVEFPEAAADFAKAAEFRPEWPQATLAKARLALSEGKFENAIEEMDRLLSKHPEYPEGWLIRARARNQKKDHLGAAKDYTEIVRRMERPEPEIYLERASALAAAGEDRCEEALRGLEEGVAKLGPVTTLNLAALDLELRMKHFEKALLRVDHLASAARRRESWFARRGDILLQLERTEEARAAYREALDAITALPSQHQLAPATVELQSRVTAALAKLEAVGPRRGDVPSP